MQEQDPSFKLPKMADFAPEVWEKLERTITDNQKITKCRACHKKFDNTNGAVTCSKRCREKHQATQKGMIGHVCAKACSRKEFYDPATELWYRTELLGQSEGDFGASFAGRLDIAKSLIGTKRQQNPIILCLALANKHISIKLSA